MQQTFDPKTLPDLITTDQAAAWAQSRGIPVGPRTIMSRCGSEKSAEILAVKHANRWLISRDWFSRYLDGLVKQAGGRG